MANRTTARPEPSIRAELEALHGQVMDTRQLAAEFVVTSIIAPDTIVVRRKADGAVGTLLFQNEPRYYFRLVLSPDQG